VSTTADTENIDITDVNALLKVDCPIYYFNGFTTALGVGDILISLQSNGKPILTLNTSYTLAKTLSEKLNGIISDLEKATGNRIMTTDQIRDSLDTRKPK
jgi:hypothetical protein